MTVTLPCGREALPVRLPDEGHRVTVLESRTPKPLTDPAGVLRRALEAPVGTPPLAELAAGRRSACVVVSDITRPVPNRVLLPEILGTLETAGIPRDAITLLIATGMHRPNEGPELVELLGGETARTYRVINHDCGDRAAVRRVATIDGVPVEINRHYLDAELKILTGLIEPHAFAGFSGGGKSVLPGLASRETVTFMHSYALLARPEVALGRVEGNPFRQHVDTVCRAAGADFLVNVLIDRNRRITGIFAGGVREAFRAGCAEAAEQQLLPLERRADLVITTGGGYPLDQTLYQAIKGLVAAREMVRPGGTVLLVAGCEEGFGGTGFAEILRASGSPEGFRRRHGDPARFAMDQWGAQAFFQTLEHAGPVLLYAPGLRREEVEAVGLVKVDDLGAAVAEALAADDAIYVVPEGPYVTARVAA